MEERYKLFLFGLDNSGKSSLLKYLKDGVVAEDLKPTKDIDILDIFINDVQYFIWDAPGQVKFRHKWALGLKNTRFLFYVVDIAANQRFKESREELDKMLAYDEAKDLPLVVLFHKYDLKEAENNLKEAIEVIIPSAPMEVYWLKTSIYSNDGIDDLRQTIFQLAMKYEAIKSLKEIQDKYTS